MISAQSSRTYIIHTKAGVQVRLDCAEIIRQQGRNEGVGKAKITI
jgi:O-acetyl-ADP-ribose deacetylase (regulator of RNase III)